MRPSIAIALDAMGSDLGPEAVVEGAAEASLRPDAPQIALVGDPRQLQKALSRLSHDASKVRIVPAFEVIAPSEEPRRAIEEKKGASICVAARLVAEGECDALVSAGPTGAVTLACAQAFRRLPGVRRAALGAVYPTERRRGEKADPFSLILDVGLTLEASAEDLVAFAIMGSAYARRISKNQRPKVGLLSIGSEPHKGTQSIVQAYRILEKLPEIEFVGNLEGMDIPRGTADVVVTSGFVGNVVLKLLEGIGETVMRLARAASEASLQYQLGLWLLRPAIRRLRQITDWEEYGGVPILGFDKLCIKAHGRSTGRAIRNAIRVAQKAVQSDLVASIQNGLEATTRIQEANTK
ncbi:MAG: phosphate acyltransferase PlsX [Sandaracinaceae bacterium]|nr:phosphate acyltransferase PlsX [Sandaracinaceae bacterium]